ncbi:MAG: hypothetical protein WCJ30_14825, partial [Deltaproteobacteria bacterium]
MLRLRSSRLLSSLTLCLGLTLSAACGAGSSASLGTSTTPRSATYTASADATFAPPAGQVTLYDAARAGATQSQRTLRPDAALATTAQAIAERAARDPQH